MAFDTTYSTDYVHSYVKYPRISPVTFKAEPPPVVNFQEVMNQLPIGEHIRRPTGENGSYEWSRLGPMGIFLEPKLYPVESTNGCCTCEVTKCGDAKSWLQNLEESLLIEKPPQPYHDMLRRLQEDRLRTTYQVDYDHVGDFSCVLYEPESSVARKYPEIACREPVKPPDIGGHDLPGRVKRGRDFGPPARMLYDRQIASEKTEAPGSAEELTSKAHKAESAKSSTKAARSAQKKTRTKRKATAGGKGESGSLSGERWSSEYTDQICFTGCAIIKNKLHSLLKKCSRAK